MVPRRAPGWLISLLGVLCAVWALIAPRTALAAAGLCDDRGATVALPGPVACIEIAVVVGVPQEEVAGFCDLRGASAVAPMPAPPGTNGSIDVGPGCGPEARIGARVDRNESPPPMVPDATDFDRAAPPSFQLVLPAPDAGAVSFPDADAYALPRGFRRGVEHPPRALVGAVARSCAAESKRSRPHGSSSGVSLVARSRLAHHAHFTCVDAPAARAALSRARPKASPGVLLDVPRRSRVGVEGAHHAARPFAFHSKERK